MNPLRLPLLALSALCPPWLSAGTEVVTASGFAAFLDGELDRVAVSSDGIATAAAGVREVADLGASVAWAAVPDGAGGLLVATGPEPRVLRVSAAGELGQAITVPGALARALARDASGATWIGASLPGSVFRIVDGGAPELVHDAAEAYVWALLPRPDGSVLVATGSPARVLRLAPGHKPGDATETWFEGPVAHVTALVPAPDGTVLASTSGDGMLVRLRGAKDFTVVHAAEGAEVRAVTPLPDGRVWFATFPAGGSVSVGAPASASGSAATSAKAGEGGDAKGESQESAGASAVEAPATNGGLLHEVDARGFVLPLWAPARGSITAVRAPAPGAAGWWVGTNDAGRLYAGEGRARSGLAGRLPAGREVAAVAEGGWILSSHPAKLYREDPSPASGATFTTAVLDARRATAWASVRAEDESGAAAPVVVRARGGQTPRVDPTWGAWGAAVMADDGTHRLALPPSRYLQVELTFGEGARVARVLAFHEPANQPPVVGAVQHHAFALEVQARQGPTLPTYDLDRLVRERGLPALSAEGSKTQFRAIPRDGAVTFAWRAVDPDGDALRFAVEIQRAGEERWIRLGEDLRDNWLVADLAALGEGRYRARVSADDSAARAEGRGATGQRLGDWFALDLFPPRLEVEDGSAVVRAVDAIGRVTGATLRSADGREQALAAVDGAFDSRDERIAVVVPEGWPAEGLLVEVVDEAGRRAVLPVR